MLTIWLMMIITLRIYVLDFNLLQIFSATITPKASMVTIGLIPKDVGSIDPSAIKRFLTSNVSPVGSTTP